MRKYSSGESELAESSNSTRRRSFEAVGMNPPSNINFRQRRALNAQFSAPQLRSRMSRAVGRNSTQLGSSVEHTRGASNRLRDLNPASNSIGEPAHQGTGSSISDASIMEARANSQSSPRVIIDFRSHLLKI